MDVFSTLRTPGGMSGFTRRYESEHDIFSGGHSSVALSAAYGIAAANKLKNKKQCGKTAGLISEEKNQ